MEGALQIEGVTELGGEEGRHLQSQQATSQQVGGAAPQLAGTGAGEHETLVGALLHQGMHHIEELRRLLDFINHHGGGCGFSGQAITQPLGSGLVGAQHVGSEQIQPDGLGKYLGQPGGFTSATGPEQKEATCGRK